MIDCLVADILLYCLSIVTLQTYLVIDLSIPNARKISDSIVQCHDFKTRAGLSQSPSVKPHVHACFAHLAATISFLGRKFRVLSGECSRSGNHGMEPAERIS